MKVFYGKNKITGDNIVVKMDFTKKKKSYVQKEFEILRQLINVNNIPIVYDYEFDNNNNIIVESLFGPSLRDILNMLGNGFSISTRAILGIQMVKILKLLHEKYIIHNDMKPSNICWGKFKNGIFDEKILFFS